MRYDNARQSSNVEIDCLGIVTSNQDLGNHCHRVIEEIKDSGLDSIEQKLDTKFSKEERVFLKGAFESAGELAAEGDSNPLRRLFGDYFVSDESAMKSKLRELSKRIKEESDSLAEDFKTQGILPGLSIE